MEKEELYKQLLLMKREYARKKKKLELAIQAKNSQEASCKKKITKQLRTYSAQWEVKNKELCDNKAEINSSWVKTITNEINFSSIDTYQTENLEDISSNSLHPKTNLTETEVVVSKTNSPLPSQLLKTADSDLESSQDSVCSSVSTNTLKTSLKTRNENLSQHELETMCLSNSVTAGDSPKKIIPDETSETLTKVTISTNVTENSDLISSIKQVNEGKTLAVPRLQGSPHTEEQSEFECNQFRTDSGNDLTSTNKTHFDSNHISKPDEELVSNEVLCCGKKVNNIPQKCHEVSSNLDSNDNCMKNQTASASLFRKEVTSSTDSHQIINSSASIFSSDRVCNSDEKISSQASQCFCLNPNVEQTIETENESIEMGSLSSDHAKTESKVNQLHHTSVIPDKLVVKQLKKNTFSLCDCQTFCDLKLTKTEMIPDLNEVVSLLNTSCSVSIHRDITACENYLVGVTKSKILFWTYTENDWHIIYQWKVSQHLEECSTATLHPYDSAVCVAVVGLKAERNHSLILYTFQGLSKRNISVTVTSVVSLSHDQIIYCSLNSFELAVASTSKNEDMKISKIHLLEDFTAVKEESSLEFTSEKLLSLATIQRLPAGLIGLTVTNVLLIWNHNTNLLLIKVPLADINEHCCYVPTAMSLEIPFLMPTFLVTSYDKQEYGFPILKTGIYVGHVIFPVLFQEDFEVGCFVAFNPTTLTVNKLLSYENIPHFNASLKTPSAQVFDKTFVSFDENILGLWDLFSGYLMASVYCSNISSVTIFHSVDQLWLITSQKGGCLHWYTS